MATKGVVCSYQEVIDLHTESDHVTCLGIHTPTGDTPRRMFKGFFDQYKKYRYLGCSMKLVPAARLPADPMHVSTEAGDLIISPRDLMNPILFHGCHGDDLGTILNTLYGSDDVMDSVSAIDVESIGVADNIKTGFYEILERLYYRALTDNTWKKASVSRGFRKDNLHPLVYSLATNRQIMPGSQGVDPLDIQQNDYLAARQRDPTFDVEPVEGATGVFNYSMKNNLTFMTPRLTSLGWMDTRNVLTSLPDDFTINVNTRVEDLQRPMAEMVNYAELPKLFMGCVLLPPAYLTEQYFRLVINHRFAFKNFRGISFTPMVQAAPAYADANDDLFDPEKFSGADFDGGSDSGDTPEPEPDPPEPDPPVGDTVVMAAPVITLGRITSGQSYGLAGVTTTLYLYRTVDTASAALFNGTPGEQINTDASMNAWVVASNVDGTSQSIGQIAKVSDNDSLYMILNGNNYFWRADRDEFSTTVAVLTPHNSAADSDLNDIVSQGAIVTTTFAS